MSYVDTDFWQNVYPLQKNNENTWLIEAKVRGTRPHYRWALHAVSFWLRLFADQIINYEKKLTNKFTPQVECQRTTALNHK